jgi:hypothetical protein
LLKNAAHIAACLITALEYKNIHSRVENPKRSKQKKCMRLQGELALTGHCRYFEREFGKEGELVVRTSGIMKSARGKCIHPILKMFRKQKGKIVHVKIR